MAKEKIKAILTRKELAGILNCSPETVKAVRNGKRINGPVAKKIKLADQGATEFHNKMLDAVKIAVGF